MNDQEMILEQYKLYVEMADRISNRRAQTNKFYMGILSGILALLSVVIEKDLLTNHQAPVFMAVSLLGIGLNILWYVNIRSYRQLNTGKFKVIHEMEQQLPFPCYDREWQVLGEGAEKGKYLQLTRVEPFVPFILAIPYVLLLVYSLATWIK